MDGLMADDTAVAGGEEDAGAKYVMNKPCNFPQLNAELREALPGVDFEYEAAKPDGSPFGPDNPLTIIVRPASTSSKKINAVLNNHVPSDTFGMTEQHSKCFDVAKKCANDGFAALTDDEKDCLMGQVASFLVANPGLMLPHKDHDTTPQ
jgi:hypothetical protein